MPRSRPRRARVFVAKRSPRPRSIIRSSANPRSRRGCRPHLHRHGVCRGPHARRVTRDGRLSPRQLIDCAHEIAQALDEAHRRGVVHRDLKPSNIMLTVHGHVKVLDFGLAKQVRRIRLGHRVHSMRVPQVPRVRPGPRVRPDLAAGRAHRSRDTAWHPGLHVARAGAGRPLNPRSDIFSLGAVLHELSACGHPFLKASAGRDDGVDLRDAGCDRRRSRRRSRARPDHAPHARRKPVRSTFRRWAS